MVTVYLYEKLDLECGTIYLAWSSNAVRHYFLRKNVKEYYIKKNYVILGTCTVGLNDWARGRLLMVLGLY